MLRIFAALSLSMLIVLPASAIECLNGQSDDILAVESWQLEDTEGEEKTITITLRPLAEKGIRLIDGTIRFQDVLGERIGEFILDRAREIAPDAPYVHDEIIAGTILERLEKLHPDDVTAIACVSALVYDDGELVEFSE